MAQLYFLPYISEHTRSFWNGLIQNKLLAQECNQCNEQFFPARSRCPNCLSKDYRWFKLSGKGTLYSWSEVLFLPPEPYLMGVVELREGIGRSIGRISGDSKDLTINQRVKASFVQFKGIKVLEWIPY
ncbi:MAG: Zn-ribbon domain-containing OB-fold protein [Candidatus Helarchaeota archaeon]